MTTPAAPDTVNSVGATDDASKGGLFNSLKLGGDHRAVP